MSKGSDGEPLTSSGHQIRRQVDSFVRVFSDSDSNISGEPTAINVAQQSLQPSKPKVTTTKAFKDWSMKAIKTERSNNQSTAKKDTLAIATLKTQPQNRFADIQPVRESYGRTSLTNAKTTLSLASYHSAEPREGERSSMAVAAEGPISISISGNDRAKELTCHTPNKIGSADEPYKSSIQPVKFKRLQPQKLASVLEYEKPSGLMSVRNHSNQPDRQRTPRQENMMKRPKFEKSVLES